MTFLDADGVRALGLAAVGENVLIDRDARVFGGERVRIGSHVRIDAFAVLSAGAEGIVVGDFVHVATHCFLAGAARIEIGDFVNLSGRTSIYSSSDDYSGAALAGPVVPDELRNVDSRPVRIGRHAIVGAGSVILPGVTLHEGAAVGAMSLVREDVPPFAKAAGIPAREIGSRARRVLELEQKLRVR